MTIRWFGDLRNLVVPDRVPRRFRWALRGSAVIQFSECPRGHPSRGPYLWWCSALPDRFEKRVYEYEEQW